MKKSFLALIAIVAFTSSVVLAQTRVDHLTIKKVNTNKSFVLSQVLASTVAYGSLQNFSSTLRTFDQDATSTPETSVFDPASLSLARIHSVDLDGTEVFDFYQSEWEEHNVLQFLGDNDQEFEAEIVDYNTMTYEMIIEIREL